MKVITPPLIEPASVSEVKEQLGIQATDTASDSLIARRIAEARQWAENYTGRAFITQTREARWDEFVDEHELPSALSLVNVKYIDTDGTLQTLTADQYEIDTYPFIPFVKAANDVTWPFTYSKRNVVRIQYTAGYGPLSTDVPPLIKEAIILLVGHWMNFQPNNENGAGISRIPYAVRDMLDIFKIEFI